MSVIIDKGKWDALVKELDELRAEVAALTAERAEAVEIHSRIMSEKCPPDEYHCTCVPALRAEVATLTAERDSEARWAQQYHEAAAQFEIERDAARAEVERLNKAVDILGKYPGGWDQVFLKSYETAQELRAEVEITRKSEMALNAEVEQLRALNNECIDLIRDWPRNDYEWRVNKAKEVYKKWIDDDEAREALEVK